VLDQFLPSAAPPSPLPLPTGVDTQAPRARFYLRSLADAPKFPVPSGVRPRYSVMRRLILSLILLGVACGPTQAQRSISPSEAVATPSATATASASPSPKLSPLPQPSTSATLLFGALEAKLPGRPETWNTAAIAGLDGDARAEATFTPMPVPNLGCIGAILPSSAQVSAGKLFYADGKGVVRSLALDGTIQTVATFPITSTQQMLSFAVSPDGTRLLGTIFTAPTNEYSCTGSPSSGRFTFDAYAATSGGSSQLVYHESWTKPQNVLALTGWDAVGPIGTYPTVWASQGGGPGSTLGVFVRVDAVTIKPLAPLADPSKCQVWNSIQSGAFACLGPSTMTGSGTADQRVNQPVSVRSADGTELWHFTVTGQNSPFGPFLAPDGQHVMICCNDLNLADSHELLVGRDGVQVNLAKGFGASGWLDSTTMVGWVNANPLIQGPYPMAYVAANAPGTVVSMGFPGLLVGTVRT
jgi:hypothetical protein